AAFAAEGVALVPAVATAVRRPWPRGVPQQRAPGGGGRGVSPTPRAPPGGSFPAPGRPPAGPRPAKPKPALSRKQAALLGAFPMVLVGILSAAPETGAGPALVIGAITGMISGAGGAVVRTWGPGWLMALGFMALGLILAA